MPEGPEVAIITDGLNSLLKGKHILEITFNDKGRYKNKTPNGFDNFKEKMPINVKSIKCKGKFIYWEFDNNEYMFNTLGMSGVWTLNEKKHTVLTIKYKNKITDTKENYLYFDDVRHFATVKFVDSKNELNKKLKTIGPDMLNDDSIAFDDFDKILNKHKTKNITVVLMNQTIISGVGNYLKSEVLYDTKISPHRDISSLTEQERKKLFKSIREKTKKSYKSGGMSKRDYVDINNKAGNFGFQLQVYGKKEDSLGNKIKVETTKDKRTTYWVENIQK